MGYDMYRTDGDNDRDGDGYFRLNIGGMCRALAELGDAEVVRGVPCPPWPQHGTAAEREAWRTSVPPGDHVGIPSYKLCSNDGWLVTPGEIRTSVTMADRRRPGWRDGLTDYVREFVEWMESTVPHGGFEVY